LGLEQIGATADRGHALSRVALVEIHKGIRHDSSINLRFHVFNAVDAATVEQIFGIASAMPSSQLLQIL